jgi:hypothetical protein
MIKLWKSVKNFFVNIDYPTLWRSCLEVFWLTLIALSPLFANILLTAIPAADFFHAAKEKIVPGEILSYCLSFLAPSLYLLIKTQGTSYKLPILHVFSITVLITYLSSFAIYLVAKNSWVKEINFQTHELDIYLGTALIFFIIAIACRIYTTYHQRNMSSWALTRKHQQDEFNETFRQSINP